MDHIKRTIYPLLLPLTAYTLFIQCGQWIVHYWVGMNAYDVFDYVINSDILYFLCIVLGIVASSLLLDKSGETRFNKFLSLAGAAAAAVAACLLMYVRGPLILIPVGLFGFFTGCIRPAIMVWFLRNVQYNQRGLLLSLTVFIPRLVFDTIFIVLFPEMTIPLLLILTIASVCMMIVCLIPKHLIKYEPPAFKQEDALPGLRFDARALTYMISIAFLLNMLIGILDMFVSKPGFIPTAFVTAQYYTRFGSLPFMIPFGLLMDRYGRQSVLRLTPFLLLLAMFAGINSTSGIAGIIGLCLMVIGSAALSMAVGLIFLDHAENTKRVALTASFGYVVSYLSRQVGTKAGLALADADMAVVYTLGSLCGIAALALIVFFYEHMRSRNASAASAASSASAASAASVASETPLPQLTPQVQPQPADNGGFGFTLRESEVFRLILQLGTISEIATKLYLSEVTVKRHVSSILKKTKTQNRAEILNRYGLTQRPADADKHV